MNDKLIKVGKTTLATVMATSMSFNAVSTMPILAEETVNESVETETTVETQTTVETEQQKNSEVPSTPVDEKKEPVQSSDEVTQEESVVAPVNEVQPRIAIPENVNNIALGKNVETSSNEGESFVGNNLVDGNGETRWSSAESEGPEEVTIDLGQEYSISGVNLFWESGKANGYSLKVSTNGTDWEDVYSNPTHPSSITDSISFDAAKNARFVKLYINVITYDDPLDITVGWPTVSLYEIQVIQAANVNKGELQTLYDEVNAYKEADYTNDTWTAFKDALNHAKEIIEKENATQTEINDALNALRNAKEGLEAKDITLIIDGVSYTDHSVVNIKNKLKEQGIDFNSVKSLEIKSGHLEQEDLRWLSDEGSLCFKKLEKLTIDARGDLWIYNRKNEPTKEWWTYPSRGLKCTSLKELRLLGITKIGNSACSGMGSALTVLELPDVEEIESGSFGGNRLDFETLDLPKLKKIGDGVFNNKIFTGTTINVPVIEEVGDRAFFFSKTTQDPPTVENLVLPATLKSLGENAFRIKNGTTVTFQSETPPVLPDGSLFGVSPEFTLKVPDNAVEAYRELYESGKFGSTNDIEFPYDTVQPESISIGDYTRKFVMLKEGKTLQLEPVVSPEGASQEVIYEINDISDAEVTVSETGLITAVKESPEYNDHQQIYIRSKSNPDIYTWLNVTVAKPPVMKTPKIDAHDKYANVPAGEPIGINNEKITFTPEGSVEANDHNKGTLIWYNNGEEVDRDTTKIDRGYVYWKDYDMELGEGQHSITYKFIDGSGQESEMSDPIEITRLPFNTAPAGSNKIISYVGEDPVVTIPSRINGQDVVELTSDGFPRPTEEGSIPKHVTEVTIPSSITTIYPIFFDHASGLTKLTFEGNVPNCGALDLSQTKLTKIDVPSDQVDAYIAKAKEDEWKLPTGVESAEDLFEKAVDKTALQELYDEASKATFKHAEKELQYVVPYLNESLEAADTVLKKTSATKDEVDTAFTDLELWYERCLTKDKAVDYIEYNGAVFNNGWCGYFDEEYPKYTTESALELLRAANFAYDDADNVQFYKDAQGLRDWRTKIDEAYKNLVPHNNQTSMFYGFGLPWMGKIFANGNQRGGTISVQDEVVTVDGQKKVRLTLTLENNGIHMTDGEEKRDFSGTDLDDSDVKFELYTKDGLFLTINPDMIVDPIEDTFGNNIFPALNGDYDNGIVAVVDVEPGEYAIKFGIGKDKQYELFVPGIYRTSIIEKEPIDYTKLDKKIAEAEKYLPNEDQYTDATWQVFKTAYDAAVAAKDNVSLTQADIDKLTTDLQMAIFGLRKDPTKPQELELSVEKVTTEENTVVVKIISNILLTKPEAEVLGLFDDLLENVSPDKWVLKSVDGKEVYAREYTENGSYEIECEDIYGSKKTVTFEITEIPEAEPVITVNINGKEFEGESLEDVITRSEIGINDVQNLEIVSGKVTQEDLAYLQQLSYLENFKMTVSDQLTLIGKDGNPTTVLSPETAVVAFAKNRSGASSPNIETVYLGGITAVNNGGITNPSDTGNKSMTELYLPDVVEVGENAFAPLASSLRQNNLSTIDLSSAKVIGPKAFWGLKALSSLKLENVESIGEDAFVDTDKLKNLTLPATIQTLDAIGFHRKESSGNVKSGTNITILATTPPSVTNGSFVSGKGSVIIPQGSLQAYLDSTGQGGNADTFLTKAQSSWNNLDIKVEGMTKVKFQVTTSLSGGYTFNYAFVQDGQPIGAAKIPSSEIPEGTVETWNTNKNGTGTKVDENTIVSELAKKGELSLYSILEDAEAPEVTVNYELNETRESVKVTLTSNEAIEDIESWTKLSDTTFEKVFTENGNSTVTVVDKAGNETKVSIEIEGIIEKVTVTFTDRNNNVVGTFKVEKGQGFIENQVPEMEDEFNEKNQLDYLFRGWMGPNDDTGMSAQDLVKKYEQLSEDIIFKADMVDANSNEAIKVKYESDIYTIPNSQLPTPSYWGDTFFTLPGRTFTLADGISLNENDKDFKGATFMHWRSSSGWTAKPGESKVIDNARVRLYIYPVFGQNFTYDTGTDTKTTMYPVTYKTYVEAGWLPDLKDTEESEFIGWKINGQVYETKEAITQAKIPFRLATQAKAIWKDFDKEAPEVEVSYSNTKPTNESVTVTLTSNEAIEAPEGWTKVDDKTFTKVYSENKTEEVTVTDLAGNPSTVNVSVTNIDKTAPVITKTTYKQDEKTKYMTVTVEVSEAVKDVEGWTKVNEEGTILTKTYKESAKEELVVEDLAGNKSKPEQIVVTIKTDSETEKPTDPDKDKPSKEEGNDTGVGLSGGLFASLAGTSLAGLGILEVFKRRKK